MNTNQSFLQSLCDQAEENLKRYFAISVVNLLLNACCLLAIGILVFNYCRVQIVVHRNLLILFSNMVLLLLINSLSYFALYFHHTIAYLTYKNSCDLLMSFWQNVFLAAPSFLCCFAYPIFHVFVMVERARATFLADKYESMGKRLGCWITIGIWIASIIYTIVLIYSSYIDPELSAQPQMNVMLTSKYNSTPILIYYIFTIPLSLFTVLCDWRITVLNNRMRSSRKEFHNYSLSRNYQLNENTLAMRLILPMDVFYTILYTLFMALSILIRCYKPSLSIGDYLYYYYIANLTNYIYTLVTIIVYIRFVKYVGHGYRRQRNVYTQTLTDEMTIHFKQLKAQWQ